jgi:hypothetical protein
VLPGLTKLDALDPGAERAQPLVDGLVATLDLTGVVDRARAFRTAGGQEHRHAGPDVGRLDGLRPAAGSGRQRAPGADRTARCARPSPTSLSTKNRRDSNIFSCMRISPSHCVAVTIAIDMQSAGKAGHGWSSSFGTAPPRSLWITRSCAAGIT